MIYKSSRKSGKKGLKKVQIKIMSLFKALKKEPKKFFPSKKCKKEHFKKHFCRTGTLMHETAEKNPHSVCRSADIRICRKTAYMRKKTAYALMKSQLKCAT